FRSSPSCSYSSPIVSCILLTESKISFLFTPSTPLIVVTLLAPFVEEFLHGIFPFIQNPSTFKRSLFLQGYIQGCAPGRQFQPVKLFLKYLNLLLSPLRPVYR